MITLNHELAYVVYWKRWLLLSVQCCAIFTRNYVSRCFAVANTITANYFRVDPAAVDVLSMGDNVLASPMCVIVAFFGSTLGLRKLMLIQLLFLSVGSMLTTVGFISRDFYWIVACGRILMGPPEAIIYILPTILVAQWFPDRELATAYGLVWFSHCMGGVVGGLVLPYLFLNNELYSMDGNDSINVTSSSTPVNVVSSLGELTGFGRHDYEDERLKFMLSFGTSALLLFISLILAAIYCKDHPPSPPSAAQKKIGAQSEASTETIKTLLQNRVKHVVDLFTNREFILLTLIIILKSSSLTVLVLLPSYLMKSFNVDITVPGWLLVDNYLVAGIGVVIGGKITDISKSFRNILIISQIGMVVFFFPMYLGYKFHNLVSLFFTYPLSGACFYISFSSIQELLVETTYPLNKMVTTSIFYSFYTISGFAFVELERWIEETTDETWAVFLLTPVNILILVLILFTNPEYKRSAVEKEADEERKRLIS